MKFLGFLFLSLLLSSAIVVADFYLPGMFLDNFLSYSLIQTFATLVGFNVAAVIFLLGQIISVEKQSGQDGFFKETRKEIRYNSYYLLISFLLSLFLLIFRPDFSSLNSAGFEMLYYIINTLILALFILAIFSIYEILKGVFILGKGNNLK